MLPIHNQTSNTKRIELSMIGAFLSFPKDSFIFADQAIAEGFSSEFFECPRCRFAWDSVIKMERDITSNSFLDFLNECSQIAVSKIERSLWISETAFFGLPCEIPKHAKLISEIHFRKKALSEISEVSMHEGNTQDIISSIEEKMSHIQAQRFNQLKDQKFDAIDQVNERMDAIIEGKKTRMLQTGISLWDETMGGIPENQIITVAGRPGGGKTSIVEQMIDNFVRRKIPVLYIQKELSKERSLGRIACKKIKIPWSLFEKFQATREQAIKLKAEVKIYESLPLFMEPVSNCNAANLRSTIKFYIKHHDIKLVVIDHLKLISYSKDQDIRLAITEVLKMFREIANENAVSIICVSQLGRHQERTKSRPTKADLSECGSIEEFSDSILALWLSEDRDSQSIWPVNWYIMKNRFGAEGEIEAMYDGPNMSFLGKKTLINHK